MTRRYLLFAAILAAWLIILSVSAKAVVDRIRVPPWGNAAGAAELLDLGAAHRVGQQFTGPWPGLYRIEVELDRGTAAADQEITFHLKESAAEEQDLWTATLRAEEIEEAGYAFEFPLFRDSKGKSFYFYLESATATSGNAIGVRYSRGAILPGASAYLDDRPVSGSLQFHTFYSLRTRDKIDVLLTRMAEGRPYFLGRKGFYVGLAALYALLLGVFLWRIAEIVVREQEKER